MNGEDVKDVYAHFGLAYCASSCLEHSIANAILFLGLFPNRDEYHPLEDWTKKVDYFYDNLFNNDTLGKLKQKLSTYEKSLTGISDIMVMMKQSVDERNYLAHHFYRENAANFLFEEGRKRMIVRLENARIIFSNAYEALDSLLLPIMQKYGYTEQIAEHAYNQILEETKVSK